ncbi:MAG: N-6 DNA methylase [Nitrososphaeria archaeon]
MSALEREAAFQDRLKELFIEASKKFRFDGLEISRVERDFPVDSRKVDLILFAKGNMPFLLIETKKKDSERERLLVDPFAPAVIGQALSYVALYKKSGINVPFFATSNPKAIAVFRTPDNILDIVDFKGIEERKYDKVIKPGCFSKLISEDYLIIREGPKFDVGYVQSLLDRLAADLMKRKTLKISLNFALIENFRLFVNDLCEACEPLLEVKMGTDQQLKNELERIAKDIGSRPQPKDLVKMMSYVLMNKLIFYKVVERKYRLPPLKWIDTSSSTKFMEELSRHFEKAVEITGDFEPIFKTGVYDLLPIPDDPNVMERINDFISFLDNVEVEEIGELTGYIYEELIPAEERHRLGQFYTPPAICELITKWAIRSPDDIVLDPGVGSGGFILQAYKRLLKLKTGKERSSEEVHKRILDQLYAIDINPFPAHLTAMNLAMKNVRAPSTNMNIIVKDFFQTNPKQDLLSPYVIRTVAGEIKRIITIPECDVIIGNPPYTRWDEIPDSTKNIIVKTLKNTITKYYLLGGFGGGLRAAQNPGIYIFWIIHATRFLNKFGRLGMIISNLWLQTDYGIRFSNFLLDHYKIKAVIDFSQRLFSIPFISTLVLLMERCDEERERMNNEVHFIYVKRDVSVDELLKIISEGKGEEGIYVKTIKQSILPRDKTWIQFFALSYEKLKEEYAKNLVIKASEIFNISRGSVTWFMEKLAGSGADSFFYLRPSDVTEHNLKEYVGTHILPALISARYSEYFTFTEVDWEQLKNKDRESYMFVCHKPFQDLSVEIKDYINWGKTNCYVSEKRGKGVLCSETVACKQRERTRGYYGWYDLGEAVEVPIFAIYQAWYKTRFVRSYLKLAMYHGLVSLIPKVELSDLQLKALLAYLNSSLTQYYIETHGRRSGGGIVALEVNIAREMPIIDVRRLSDEQARLLAIKFDELEQEARKIGGASEKEQVEKLKPKIYEIDEEIGKILNIPKDIIRQIQESVEQLVNRRISGSKEPAPESVKGEEPFKARPKKSTKKRERAKENFMSLTEFV